MNSINYDVDAVHINIFLNENNQILKRFALHHEGSSA